MKSPTDSSRPLSVSVVLGTYNGSKYVESQLQSIISQTRPPTDIWVSDDGSIDETLEIVSHIAVHSPVPIKIHRNITNLGFGLNFINAARRPTSDLIAFSDQDDIWRSDKLELCVKLFLDPAISLTVHKAELINENNVNIGHFDQYIHKNGVEPPLTGDPWGGYFGFSMVFRRELLELININKTSYYLQFAAKNAHDRLICQVASLAGKTARINESLVSYRQHDKNVYGVAIKPGWRRSGALILNESAHRVCIASTMMELLATHRSW